LTSKGVVEIHDREDGLLTRRMLDGEAVTVGVGRDAGIRLGASSGLSSRHLTLTALDDGVRIDVLASTPSGVYFAGSEHRSVQVPWGDEVYLGTLRLDFVRSATGRSGRKLLLLFLGPLSLAVAGAAAVGSFAQPSPSSRSVEAPPLLRGTATCSARDQAILERRAREAERAASAKKERFAFVGSEGAAAARLYQEAADCYERAGRPADGARVARTLESWTSRLNEEYAALRFRLRTALDQGREVEALAATKALEELLAGSDEGPYLEWLSALRRELERKATRKRR
jgi:hypothetical protein